MRVNGALSAGERAGGWHYPRLPTAQTGWALVGAAKAPSSLMAAQPWGTALHTCWHVWLSSFQLFYLSWPYVNPTEEAPRGASPKRSSPPAQSCGTSLPRIAAIAAGHAEGGPTHKDPSRMHSCSRVMLGSQSAGWGELASTVDWGRWLQADRKVAPPITHQQQLGHKTQRGTRHCLLKSLELLCTTGHLLH